MFTKEELENLYFNQLLTQQEIANKFHCNKRTIIRWFKHFDIKARKTSLDPKKKAWNDTREEVVCNECNKNFLKQKKRKHPLNFCSPECQKNYQKKHSVVFPKDIIEKLHFDEKLTQIQIAQKLNCSTRTIQKNFEKYNIIANPGWLNPKTGLHYANKQKTLQCNNCGKTLLRSLAHISKLNFCSKSCKGSYMSKYNTGSNHQNYKKKDIIAQSAINFCCSPNPKLETVKNFVAKPVSDNGI